MFTLGDTKVLGSTTVNEFHAGLMRNVNIIGQPHGGLGVTLASQGFATGAGTPGIVVQAPQFEGVENIVFPSFVMGVPITNANQWNNTLYLQRLGLEGRRIITPSNSAASFTTIRSTRIPTRPSTGHSTLLGTETGSAFADFLLGVPSNFTQTTGQHFYLRNQYAGAFRGG